MRSCTLTWALLLLNSLPCHLGDASSLASVNQPTEQSYGNERVSSCFQSRLAATCYCRETGEKQELTVAM